MWMLFLGSVVLAEGRRAGGPPKKRKTARANIEWVSQVSFLRPGVTSVRFVCVRMAVSAVLSMVSDDSGVSTI